MPQKQYLLTEEGLAKLRQELDYLKTVRRQQVAEKLQSAIEHTSADHNAQYEDAKNEQAFVEGRILTLEAMVNNAAIIHPEKAGWVGLGSKVAVVNQDGKREQFVIVDSVEADPSQGKISYQSPVGKAILGKKVGEGVELKVPAGAIHLLITEIE